MNHDRPDRDEKKYSELSGESSGAFSPNEWLRYTRHIQLPKVGAAGQSKLKNSHVLIIGSGGLGSPVALYLAAAGVGTLTLIDHDEVDLTNLQRQILFTEESIGKRKAKAGAEQLAKLNSTLQINPITSSLSVENAETLIKQSDIVVDCTDNFATRYLVNDTCSRLKKPWVFASIHQFSGQCSLFTASTGCFRCLFPDYPTNIEDCNSAGVLGVLPGLLGTFQANETIKYLCGLNTPLEGNLLLVDALDLQFQKIKLSKNPGCICCEPNNPDRKKLASYYNLAACETIGENTAEAAHVKTKDIKQIDPSKVVSLLNENKALLIDVRTAEERNAFNIGGLHIPVDEISNRLNQIAYELNSANSNKQIVCYCQSGARSIKAAQILLQHSIDATTLSGGLVAYIKHGERTQ